MAAICREFLRSFRLRPLIREKSRLAVYRRRLKSDITLAYEKIPRFRNSGNVEMCSRRCITDRTAALRGLVSTVSDGAVCYLIRLTSTELPCFRNSGNMEVCTRRFTRNSPRRRFSQTGTVPQERRAPHLGVSADTDYVCHRCHSAPPQLNVKRREHCTHSLYAPADCTCDLARVQLLIFCQQLNNGECNRIAEQPAQT